jgi:hypothetical protein
LQKLIIMDQKDKAKELVDKMLNCYQGHIDEYTAKQCALIAVDEILNSCKTYLSPYYLEVKKEIEKL